MALALRSKLPLLIILFLVEFVRGAYLLTYLPNVAVHILGFSLATVGLAVSAHYITDTVCKGIIGWLVDRVPARRVIVAGLFVSLVGLLLMSYAHQKWMFVLSSALFGLGVSPVWLIVMGMATQVKDRATQMGSIYMVWLIGMGGGPVLINFVMARSISSAFLTLIVLWLLTILISFGVPNQKEKWHSVSGSFKDSLQQWIVSVKGIKGLVPGMVLQTLAAGALVPILPIFATEGMQLTQNQYGYVLIAGGLATVICLIPTGKLSDRFGIKPFLFTGFLLCGLSLLWLSRVQGLRMAVLTAVILGVSYAILLPAWNALLAMRISPAQEGMGWGMFASLEGIGVMVGPALGGWLASRYQETTVIIASASLFLLMAIFYLWYPIHRSSRSIPR